MIFHFFLIRSLGSNCRELQIVVAQSVWGVILRGKAKVNKMLTILIVCNTLNQLDRLRNS